MRKSSSILLRITIRHFVRNQGRHKILPKLPDRDRFEPALTPLPREAVKEMVIPIVLDDDERIWVEHRDQAWTRPLCLNVSNGYWIELLRVRKSGVLHRHRHPNPVHGLVLKGRWHYLEHDWVAEEGPYIFEPSGETHTLTVPEGVDEMITFFHVTGYLSYIDPDGNPLGYDDVFTLIDDCRAYYTKVGLGADFVDQFIR